MIDFSDILFFDGAMGTMLQRRGLRAGEHPELMNIEAPQVVTSVHHEYVEAGSDFVTANTFGANRIKLGDSYDIAQINTAAVLNAKASGARYVALDVGPTGAMLEPFGNISFEQACTAYKEQISAGAAAGADAVIIETMSDLLEAKAAVIAAKESCTLPIFATMTYDESGHTFLGTDPVTATVTLCALGVSAVGVNCSLGPRELTPVVEQILEFSTVPVIVQANAGLPLVRNGITEYPVGSEEYAQYCKKLYEMGVGIFGGCCGTTPEYISRIHEFLNGKKRIINTNKSITTFTSGRKSVIIQDNTTAIIGERINPTGKKKLQQALRAEDYSYVIDEAVSQEESGADILDVNCGLPDIDEPVVLTTLVRELQQITALPLQIDSSDPQALESAVRIYNGRPIINSVNGKEESLSTVLPIAAKYGAAIVALTLDENGIPTTANGRLEIARRILKRALEYGLKREDVIVDCLVLTASTNQSEVLETLNAVKLVKSELGVKTVLGVSNVSFGLPSRELINSVFLASAFGAGLNLAIINPLSAEYRKTVLAFKVLNNEDKGAANYLSLNTEQSNTPTGSGICELIVSGRKDLVPAAVEAELANTSPEEIINGKFVPALDIVGNKYENGLFYLPQLMASADAVKSGFEVLKKRLPPGDRGMGTIILATVKGDIHDIGKNIVKMMLENYGYTVIDLGKDVSPQAIVESVTQNKVKLVGLSALMTTTVGSMKATIELLRACNADCKVMVGGAVLNEEYAQAVGADYYAKDAAQSVKIARNVFKTN